MRARRLALLAVVAVALGGCGDDRSASTAEAAPAEMVPVTTVPAPVVTTVPAPTTTAIVEISPELSAGCPSTAHGAGVDRERQRAWLCDHGIAVYEFPFTGAISQPDPGTYPVYAKDMQSSSTSSAGRSDMTHFVAFTRGKFRGARIAFHSVPTWHRDGSLVQPLDSVGDPARRGESAGCLRVLPDDAVKVWDWLAIGDEVNVVN
jgi:hypothetical protein